MGKRPVYAIMALIFIGIIKLIQVTVFDVEQYEKNKKSSFSNYNTRPNKPVAKKIENETKMSSDTATLVEEFTPSDTISMDMDETSSDLNESTADSFESPQEEVELTEIEDQKSYNGLEDLKNNYLAPIIASLPTGQLREDVVIRYYRHEKDGEKVYSLRKIGFYIHEKEATETAGLGSNVLYYGDDVNVEDIQIVAYTLLEEGLPLKSILPTQFSWKSTSIEVGTDTLLLDSPALTELDVQNFSK